ncbi:MAG: CDP-alcohol phosphatidyltransferase family protein [Lachnospiraceae bacterium]|nr:CDP-alcohol phosphatidyltransferase family protein [Lachnospiraceae bacterium]
MKKELFSIPNLMGYFRILMLPVFLVWYHRAETPEEFGAAFALLAVIFLSDALDGFVARRFHMVTGFGKILDPVADKLVQGTLTLAVSFRHSWMKVFFAVFLIKEVYMSVMGMYLLRVKNSLNGARWYGKLCTAVVDSCILILLFLPKLPADVSNTMILCMIGVELFTIGMYLKFHLGILREKY